MSLTGVAVVRGRGTVPYRVLVMPVTNEGNPAVRALGGTPHLFAEWPRT